MDDNISTMYRDAVWCVDPGACNLLGVANSMPAMLKQIESECGRPDRQAELWVDTLISCANLAFDRFKSTHDVNSAPDVRHVVVHLVFLAYSADSTSPALCHPAMRLVVDQLANLSGCCGESQKYDNHLFLFGQALDECRDKAGIARSGQ